MCGIFGFSDAANGRNVIVEGLKRLEYRGYDSVGVSLKAGGRIFTFKSLEGADGLVPEDLPPVRCGIGHTRWATHGKPDLVNAHPHRSYDGRFYIVHNGILTNEKELRQLLASYGIECVSQTDSELIAHLIAYNCACRNQSAEEAVLQTAEQLKGSYTFLTLPAYENKLIAYRKNASLFAGKGDGYYFSSDITALYGLCPDAIKLDDDDMAVIDENGLRITRFGREISKKHMDISLERDDFADADCHMEAEIAEIPDAVAATAASLTSPRGLASIDDAILCNAKNVIASACGTALHAGMYAKYLFEKLLKIPASVIPASELRCNPFLFGKETAALFISQSGETSDTISALRYAASKGCTTIAVTNNRCSTLASIADYALFLDCGPEIAVAATKSYICQLAASYFTVLRFGAARNILSGDDVKLLTDDFYKVQSCLKQAVCSQSACDAAPLYGRMSTFFIGKGQDVPTAMEGSLKLKEITYKHSEAYPAGELKHGPIALVDRNTLAIAVLTDPCVAQRIKISVNELKARGAKVLAVTTLDLEGDYTVKLRTPSVLLAPLVTAVPLQQYALAVCRLSGLNPDKPRNLAKSVTVE